MSKHSIIRGKSLLSWLLRSWNLSYVAGYETYVAPESRVAEIPPLTGFLCTIETISSKIIL